MAALKNGSIEIDDIEDQGLYFAGQVMLNEGILRLGGSDAIGGDGLILKTSMTNTQTGRIYIDNTQQDGINMDGAALYNSGGIYIGTQGIIGEDGMYSRLSSVYNYDNGQFVFQNITNRSIYAFNQIFDNYGMIDIGLAGATMGTYATLENRFAFNNYACSEINIFSDNGISSQYIFTNRGTILEYGSGASDVEYNYGTIRNLNGGSFSVDSLNAGILVSSTEPLFSAICQDATVYLDSTGSDSISVQDVYDASVNDSCIALNFSLDREVFTCSDLGSQLVTLSIKDEFDNLLTCQSTISVKDTIHPTASCRDITVHLNVAGFASLNADTVDNGSWDNCSIQGFALSQTQFTCADLGANQIYFRVTDAAGNEDSCLTTITVVDTFPPTPLCKDVLLYLDANGSTSLTADAVDNGSSDNCSIQGFGLAKTQFSCADLGANQVYFSVTDASGNRDSCLTTITVSDTFPPTAICRDVLVYLDETGSGSLTADAVNDGSWDNCSLQDFELAQTQFTCTDLGVNQIYFKVYDTAGNQDSCLTTITVSDTFPPTAICQNIQVQLDEAGSVSITASDLNNNSTDNCSILEMDLNINTFGCDDIGDNVVMFTVTDTENNQDSCEALVTVIQNPNSICGNLSCTDCVEFPENTWLGTVDTDWHNPGNWSLGVVPTLCHQVIIPDGVVYIYAGSEAKCYLFESSEGAEVIEELGSTLVIGECLDK